MRKKTHLPNPQTRQQVRLMIGHGLTEDTVGRVLGVSDRTIRRHYKAELGCGFAEAEATVKRTAFELAIGRRDENGNWIERPNVAMLIFLLKARYGWSEKAQIEVTTPDDDSAGIAVAAIGSLLDQIAAAKQSGDASAVPEIAARAAKICGVRAPFAHHLDRATSQSTET